MDRLLQGAQCCGHRAVGAQRRPAGLLLSVGPVDRIHGSPAAAVVLRAPCSGALSSKCGQRHDDRRTQICLVPLQLQLVTVATVACLGEGPTQLGLVAAQIDPARRRRRHRRLAGRGLRCQTMSLVADHQAE